MTFGSLWQFNHMARKAITGLALINEKKHVWQSFRFPLFRAIPHLAKSALCRWRSEAGRLCTTSVSEGERRWSHSEERWGCWWSRPWPPHSCPYPACFLFPRVSENWEELGRKDMGVRTHRIASVDPLNKDRGCIFTRVICQCNTLDNVKMFSSIYPSTNSSH